MFKNGQLSWGTPPAPTPALLLLLVLDEPVAFPKNPAIADFLMYLYSNTSDYDVSLQSGDSDKYWWIGGTTLTATRPTTTPTTIDVESEPQDEAVDGGSKEDRELMADMKDELRNLQGHIVILKEQYVNRETGLARSQAELATDEEELARSEASNHQLVQRVAGLCTFLCGAWVDQVASTMRIKQLVREVRISRWVIVLLMGVTVKLAFK